MSSNHAWNTARTVLATLVMGATLAACGGGGGSNSSAPTQPAAATDLTLASTSNNVTAGGAGITLTASMNGAGSVSWALAAGAPGTLSATSGASVVYTPPAQGAISAVTAVTITASSGALSRSITLQVAPGGIAKLALLAGTISTNRGNNVDGTGTGARFLFISDLAADSAGTIYVLEQHCNCIRTVSADGKVGTLASDAGRYPDGDLIKVGVGQPTQLSQGPDGSLYVSDNIATPDFKYTTYFHKIAKDGTISLLGSTAELTNMVVGADGALYAYNGAQIYTMGAGGVLTLLAGDGKPGDTSPDAVGTDGTGAAAHFNGIRKLLAAPDGSLYALDFNTSLRQISKSGVVTTLATYRSADGLDSFTLDAQGHPLLLFSDAAPSSSYEVRKYSAGVVTLLYRVNVVGSVSRNRFLRIQALPDGSVVTADATGLSRIGTDGHATPLAGVHYDEDDLPRDGQGADARLITPGLLAADRAGNIYAVDEAGSYTDTATVRKITPAGVVSTVIEGKLGVVVTGMQVTPAGALVVSVLNADGSYGGGIYQLSDGGAITLIAGAPGGYDAPKQVDGVGAAARFGQPTLVGVDASGNLYVTDLTTAGSSASTIRRITPAGVVSTVTSLPAGLGAAPDGNTYELSAGRAVYRVTPAGVRTLVAGSESGTYAILPDAQPPLLALARSIVPLDANRLAIAAGNGIYILTLP